MLAAVAAEAAAPHVRKAEAGVAWRQAFAAAAPRYAICCLHACMLRAYCVLGLRLSIKAVLHVCMHSMRRSTPAHAPFKCRALRACKLQDCSASRAD